VGSYCEKGTHNECLQVHPIITDQEPYVTGKAETACGAAGSHRDVSMGVDLEDGVRGDCKHRCVRPKNAVVNSPSTKTRKGDLRSEGCELCIK